MKEWAVNESMSLDDKVRPLFTVASEKEADERADLLSQNALNPLVCLAVEQPLASHDEASASVAEPAAPEPSETVDAHLPHLKSGRLLARRFKIVRFIAHGGMGELYEAEDLELHESLAIKTLRLEILQQPKAIDRFKREVHLARKVTHPNVCRVFDLFRDQPEGEEEIVFITMEFLKSETLADRMRRSGRMSPEESLPLIKQMASALDAAHEAGVVHRDFKPGNVMLVEEPAGLRAVVTDFGLALRGVNFRGNVSLDGATWDVSTHGALYGTLAYMAPEQIEGHPASAASDLYALGLVIYEMVTGARPFTGETPMAATVKRLIEPPPAPRVLDPKLDPVWEHAILRCLERDPSQRFTTAEGVIDALMGTAQPARRSKQNRQSSVARWRPAGYRYILSTGIAAIALAASAVGYRYYSHRAHAPLSSTLASGSVSLRPAVAVLGFKNLSRKPDTEWLSTALSETLNTELALGQKLRTIPGENVARTKLALSLPDEDSYGQDTLARIRSNMNTDIVVLGSYLDSGKKSGGHVRIDLRAQDTRTGNTIAVISENGTEAQVLDLILRTGAEVREKLGAGADTPAVDEAARTSAPSSPKVARLYSEGLKRLWQFDSVGAKDILERVVAEEPAYPLGHDALAQAWLNLGYEAKAKEEAEKAFHLSGNLSRERRLLIEAHYREINHEWGKAVELYDTLFNFFPDNVDYGVRVANAEGLDGKGKDAARTIQTLRNLPAPAKDDPRIDLAESDSASTAGDYKRAQTAAAEAEQKGTALRAPLVVAAAQLSQCGAWERLGEYAQAITNCEIARQAYVSSGDRGRAAQALLSLSVALYHHGDFKKARDAQKQAATVFEEIGDKRGQAAATNDIAVDLSEVDGDHLMSERAFEQALALWREVGNKPKIASTMANIASEFKYLGRLPEASAMFREAAALDREAGSKGSEVFARRELGATLYLEGDLAGSEKALNEVLEICQSLGPKMQCGAAFGNMGDVLESEGKLDQAQALYKQSLAVFDELGTKEGAAEVQMSLADLLREADRPMESEALIRQTIPVFHASKLAEDEDQANVVLARALLAEGKSDEAAHVINSIAITGVEDKGLRFEFTLASALVQAASGKPDELAAATKSINALLTEATRGGFKEDEFEARLSLGEVEMKSKHTDSGRRTLAALEKEARSKGFVLIATKAATAARA
jgi:serine/threonine protein kinase/tetratricopeptide (TPR) repeat protein